jgi:hypothetical protein
MSLAAARSPSSKKSPAVLSRTSIEVCRRAIHASAAFFRSRRCVGLRNAAVFVPLAVRHRRGLRCGESGGEDGFNGEDAKGA